MHGANLLIDVLLLALATGAVVDLWLNGSAFATWRARVEAWENVASELMGCSLCLNYQVPFWLTLALWVPSMAAQGWAAVALRAVLVWLAAGRLAWFLDHMCLGAGRGYDREDRTLDQEDP